MTKIVWPFTTLPKINKSERRLVNRLGPARGGNQTVHRVCVDARGFGETAGGPSHLPVGQRETALRPSLPQDHKRWFSRRSLRSLRAGLVVALLVVGAAKAQSETP